MTQREDHNKIFQKKINERLQSEKWDAEIAHKVVEKSIIRNNLKRSRIKYFISAMVPVSAAAVFLIFFTFSNPVNKAEKLNNWINSQIDGTYKTVFNSATDLNQAAKAQDSVYSDYLVVEVDHIIDHSLSLR